MAPTDGAPTASAPTATIFAALTDLIGQPVVLTHDIRVDQIVEGDSITYRPVQRAARGTVTAVSARAETVEVTLAPDECWDGEDYVGGHATVRLTGSDHPVGGGTFFHVAAEVSEHVDADEDAA